MRAVTTYRHRSLNVLPLALLAIVLQVFLPALAVRAVSAGLPVVHLTICSADPGTSAPNGGDHVPGQHAHCPLCQIAASASPTLVAGQAALPPPARSAAAVIADPAESAGPRGPPEHRHRARAPPRFS